MVARKRPSAPRSGARRSPTAAQQLAKRILAEQERFAKEAAARKQRVEFLPEADLIRRLRGQGTHSPFISSLSWNQNGVRGGTVSAGVGIVNPDPVTYPATQLFAHAFWGPGNLLPDLNSFVLSADPAFPRFAVGIQAPANAPLTYGFIDIPLPATIAPGTYFMHWLVFLLNSFGVGTYLDRAGSYTTVT